VSIHFPEYEIYDGIALAEVIRKGDFSAEEVLEAAIERIELIDPFTHAITHKMYDEARVQLKHVAKAAPFAGVPFLLKDLIDSYANVPTTFGSRWLKNYTRDFHSELVQRYLQAGLIVVGKTNAPELGLGPVTEPKLNGLTSNPWNLSHTAGGSSGGSAAAVAARMVPIAHGGDGGGSIRIPASCCGLFGMKPTRGRTPSGPDMGRLWQGLVVEHALTRSVRDSAALLDVTLGNDVGTPLPLTDPAQSYLSSLDTSPGKLRIALIKQPFFTAEIHADCITAVERAGKLCTDLGHHVEAANLAIDSEELLLAMTILMSAETGAAIKQFKRATKTRPGSKLELPTRALASLGHVYKAQDLVFANTVFDKVTRQVGTLLENYDVILTPTLAQPPLKHGELSPNWFENLLIRSFLFTGSHYLMKRAVLEGATKIFAFMPYTALFNITGQPAMSVPLYWNRDNLPIGSQFAGRFGDEKTLFQLARQLEKALPWQHRVPAQNQK